jgi:hypothetical protein
LTVLFSGCILTPLAHLTGDWQAPEGFDLILLGDPSWLEKMGNIHGGMIRKSITVSPSVIYF